MVRNHHTPPSPDPAPGPGTESTLTRPFSPTSEPWEFLEDRTGIVVFKRFQSPRGIVDNRSLAHFPKLEISMASPISDDEVSSNARLFLAAPRMLRFIRHLYGDIGINPNGGLNREDFLEVRGILRELEGGGQ
jgi:hypothetical protein